MSTDHETIQLVKFFLLMDDSDPKVHDASYQVFGEIIDLLGECTVQGFIN